MRFVSKSMHAYIDYPVALSLIWLPMLLDLSALAANLSAAAGLTALLVTALTNHVTGLVRFLPFKLHLLLDGFMGAAFLIAPVALGLHSADAVYFLTFGVAILLVVAAHRPDRTISVL